MSFYKGVKFKTQQDKVLQAYIDGYKLVNGCKVEIVSNHLKTKYNLYFRDKINDLIQQYVYIIILENIVIELMNKYNNPLNIYVSDIWRLIKAQSGTIRFLRKLRMAVNTHILDSNEICLAIKGDLRKTQERATRNLKYINNIIEDIGILGILQELANGDIMDYCLNNILDKNNDNLGTVINECCSRIIDIALNTDIDIGRIIEEKIKIRDKEEEDKATTLKSEIKLRNEQDTITSKLKLITRDSVRIQNAIDLCKSSSDEDKESARALINRATKRKREGLNKYWYISYCSKHSGKMVYHIGINGTKCKSIRNILLMDKEQAEECKINMTNNEKFKKYVIEICQLII